MNILQLSGSPVAGVPYILRDIFNKYSAHECKALTGPSRYPDGRAWDRPDANLADPRGAVPLIKWADAIVLHNGGHHRNMRIYHQHFKGKKLISYYHSEPHRVDRSWERRGIPTYVIAQGHSLLYPKLPVLPNLVDIFDELMLPAPPLQRPEPCKLPVVGYAPSNRQKTVREMHNLMKAYRYSSKGYPVTKPVLDRLAGEGWKTNIYWGIPFRLCMVRRKECHVFVDEVVTGSYHRSTLEACSHAQVAVNFISEPVRDIVKRIADAKDVPFLRSNSESLYEEMKRLQAEPCLMKEMGEHSRRWMETHWHPKVLLERWWLPALEN